jgi:hypothetical protein
MVEHRRVSEWTPHGRVPGPAPKFRYQRVALTGVVMTISGIVLTTLRVVSAYAESQSRGNGALISVIVILAAGAILALIVNLIVWVPSIPRSIALRRMLPGHTILVARIAVGYWEGLARVDSNNRLGRRIQNAGFTLDGETLTIWKGVRRPYPAAQIPLAGLISADWEIATYKGFRSRVVVMGVRYGAGVTEIPFSLCGVGSFGLVKMGRKSRSVLLKKLGSDISQGQARSLSPENGVTPVSPRDK